MTAASKLLATALLTVATGVAYAQSPGATDPGKSSPAPSVTPSNTENQRTPIDKDKSAASPSTPSSPSPSAPMPDRSAASPAPAPSASGSASSADRVTRSDSTSVERPARADRN